MKPLSTTAQWLLSLAAFFFTAFGQPAWLPLNGLISSSMGLALFWRVLLAHPNPKHRFFLAFVWFSAVQLVQLSWFTSHPYWYIYSVYFFASFLVGFQFGLLALLIRPETFMSKSLLQGLKTFLPIAALWTLLEWSRLFLLSGLSWNPLGVAITGSLYALQSVSIAGVFGLSFWAVLVNLLALWAWFKKTVPAAGVWAIAALLPYLYGYAHITFHDSVNTRPLSNLTVMLVQTAFSPVESKEHPGIKNIIQHVVEEWRQILHIAEKHKGQPVDLIALPEFVVPFGTYSNIFPLQDVLKAFYEVLGPDSLALLPSLDTSFSSLQITSLGPRVFVSNAYWTQGLANNFQADILIGLQDAEDVPSGIREYYSSAIFIRPQVLGRDKEIFAERYAKRVLVPMGEYIPFEACKKLAESYGICSSFTCGKEAALLETNGIYFSPSICYEETFGDIMREGRQKGADLFVNLTSDVWFPNSRLPRQHLDHARLRTVENGVPLVRACNTGITAAIDSLGRDIAVLGGRHPERVEWVPDALVVDVPVYSYRTLYSKYGDSLVVGLSLLILVVWGLKRK